MLYFVYRYKNACYTYLSINIKMRTIGILFIDIKLRVKRILTKGKNTYS